MKGGEDGGVDVAAVDALKSHKFQSISLKEGGKGVANKMHGATFIMVIAPTKASWWAGCDKGGFTYDVHKGETRGYPKSTRRKEAL